MADLAFLIGKRIREIRRRKGLRQEDVEALGISYKYFQKVETGKANVTLKTIEKIASALKVDPTEFFDFSQRKSAEVIKLSEAVNEIIKTIDERKGKESNILDKKDIKVNVYYSIVLSAPAT